MDITYYILVTPLQRQKAALNLNDLPDKFGIIPGSQLESMKQFGGIVDLSKVFIVNYTFDKNYSYRSFIESYKLYKELRKNDYDAIHLTWPPSYSDIFIYFLRKKILLTIHDPFPHSSQVFEIREMERKRAFKYIDYFTILNSSQKDEFIKAYSLNQPKKHIYDSSLSILDYLSIYKDSFTSVNSNQVLFFGQIFTHKGVDYLLKAMVQVHESCPNAKLIVAGGGRYWFDLNPYKNLEYIEIRNRFIPDSELVKLVTSSSFIVLPYIDATQSGVQMVAYAFDRPCIATNVGGLPETVKNGYNGIIVEPKDSSTLAKAMLDLLQNPQKVEQFSNQIKRDYKEGDASWLAIAKQHKEIYKSICTKNKKRDYGKK